MEFQKVVSEEYLKKILIYDPETGVFKNKITRGPRAIINNISGTLSPNGYTVICINRSFHYAHRLAWLYVYGYMPCCHIDHINRNRNDNRVSNLRLADVSFNTFNSNLRSDNKTKVRGVCWNKTRLKLLSQIKIRGKNYFLGNFKNFSDAVNARYEAEKKYRINKIDNLTSAMDYVSKNLIKKAGVEVVE